MKPPVIGTTWVYLHVAADGHVLYVGQTYNPEKRHKQHRRAPWWPQVDRVVTVGRFRDDHARRLERFLIEQLDPPHNVAFTSRWRDGLQSTA